ncbi:MAG: EAL domain-containing protein [Clostridia bacterium]|nr:EAL domain-containing protein [Clostridia bacterium]
MTPTEKFSFDQRTQEILERLTIPFAIYQYLDKRVVTIALSQGFCDEFGFKKLEDAYRAMDSDMYRATHPDDKTRVADAAYRFAAFDAPYDIVYRTRTLKDPDYIILHAYGKSIYPKPDVRLCLTWYANEGACAADQETYESVLNQTLNRFLKEESQYRGSYYDYMTGLPNIAYFYELAEAGRQRMRAQKSDSAILFFDLTGLKRFNRCHGFSEGDRLLRAVAEILAKHFSNESCARFAQDHFAAFAPEKGLKERLDALIAECAWINDGKNLPLRIGIYPDRIEKVEVGVACDRARLAANTRKKAKESYYSFFDMDMLAEEKNRQEIIDNLDRAIEEGWIKVYYQPIVRSANGKVCDVEALARWQDPVRGLLAPASFIPVLEDAMLIPKLDLCVVKQVLKDVKTVEAAGMKGIPVSINFSRMDFDACDLVNEICALVDEAGVDRKMIHIEITESVVGSDFDYIKEQVERFRAQGFQVWMDDFGSGYSSLDVLQSIKFDLIKFDMGFMRRLDEGDEGKIILTEMMKMATSLGVDTVCEGVETEEQVRFLLEIGCAKLQGYYFMKPALPEQILEKFTVTVRDGIEDMRQAAYYDTMGRVNLYDLSFLVNQDDSVIKNTFETIPMGIMEVNSQGDKVRYVRTNQSFRDFMKRAFKLELSDPDMEYSMLADGHGSDIMKAIAQCRSSVNRAFIDEELEDRSVVHSFLRRIVQNPVNGRDSFAVAVLSITAPDESTTYIDIARALAADYYSIYAVDLDTDQFIEYSSPVGGMEMAVERHGENFFESGRQNAHVYIEDVESFTSAFSKEKIIQALDEQGVFSFTYRLVDEGVPKFVSMKINRMQSSGNRIIIGISMIDAQMKQQEEQKKLRQEKASLGRIAALSPDYLALYIIDPQTGRYTQYNAAQAYEDVGLAKQGEDFFADVLRDSPKAIAPEDLERHLRVLTKENMLAEIQKNGSLIHNYRMLLDGKPMPVSLRATLIQENNGQKIILGITNDEEEYRRKLEKAYKNANSKATIYTHVAHALARDCTDLYYVNLDTDEFIAFHTDDERGVLSEARRGENFFEAANQEAKIYIHPDDLEEYLKVMNREFLSKTLNHAKVYELTFRRIERGTPFYVQMKISRMEDDPRFIVFAISDVDELMRKRREEEKIQEERVVYARLHALTGNFIVVYVVDPETDHYREFSATDDYEKGFAQEKTGEDFFGKVRDAACIFNYPEDLNRFLTSFTKENVLAEIERSGLFTLGYRFMMEGEPIHVQMKAAMVEEKEGPRLIVGLNNIDAQVRQEEAGKEIERQKEIYDQITASLTEQYDTLYYIDLEDSTCTEISSTDAYKKLNVPATGSDFFADSRRSIRKYVHPEDQEKALHIHYKDVMLDNLKDTGSFSLAWRLVVNGKVQHIRHTELMARDGKHLIVCIKNIDAEVQAKLDLEADQKKSVTFTQIAERLASHYDLIYYIDCQTAYYAELSAKRKSGELKVQEEGDDFFSTARKNADRLIYSEDRERIKLFLDRDHLISQLESRRQLTEDYRMNTGGGNTQYTRMTVTYSSDRSHFIICVEDREKDVQKEKEHLAALATANEMARRDELTGTKNKTAYHEIETELQKQIEEGNASFGIVVCDINGLKVINDTEGHKAGDDYIRAACRLVCNVFHHSPVFRIGGDEFAVVLRGQDYVERENLLSLLRRQVEENIRMGEGAVVASGLAVYRPNADHAVEAVFNRADSEMYGDKARLKQEKLLQETHSLKEKANIRVISEDRRLMLDMLFKSFEVVSEGTYVYLCDMKYDLSRWSKSAVDAYGLPAEYMYGAGDIWENHIHPEDREAYHKGIEEIFSGNASGHDMQYRARRTTGEYDVCTCRGVVIRNPLGEPDYFAGTIRNHGIQGHVDTLTGLRNQYGFFEDLDGCIKRNAEVCVALFGINKFSEFNEMYGYHFGNRVLQRYARKVFELTGNMGHTYRIDGTKFAVISGTLSIPEVREQYNRFRALLHEGIEVDGKRILLDLHCGALRVDNFEIDSQTAYACLNFAYEESKTLRKGDMVEFQSDLNERNHRRLEQLHAIRASIKRGYKGFYLLYQPVVDAETERLIGAEALLRWKNKRYGLVPPDQFIPILESDPLFPELGEWILREAILAAKQFLHQIPGFVVNVNLSYSQIEKPGFADMVVRILNELDYPPEHLCLEVTERCRLLDMELLKNVTVNLKSRGILVAMDDFGTGFSAVGILKEIPFDVIKVDRSFVKGIEENETDRKLIWNVANLAAIFKAKVCVEGVETMGIRDILRECHAGSFQGYYYAKPLLPEEILTWKKPSP